MKTPVLTTKIMSRANGTSFFSLWLLSWSILFTKLAQAQPIITHDQWLDIELAMKGSSLIYFTKPAKETYGDFYFFDGKDDAAFVDKTSKNDTCIVGFRGSGEIAFPGIGLTLSLDGMQNINFISKEYCAKNATTDLCCDVHSGFLSAYETSYQQDLEAIIENECIAAGRELILTGHSQGAGVAQVAALRYADYNPKLYLFGSPATFKDECLSRVIKNDFIRFLNVESDRRFLYTSIDYDAVGIQGSIFRLNGLANAFGLNEGALLVLPPDTEQSTACSYYANATTEPFERRPIRYVTKLDVFDLFRRPSRLSFGFLSVHMPDSYENKIKAIRESIGPSGGQVQLNGFESGVVCLFDGECESKQCQMQFTLRSGFTRTCV